MPLHVPVPIPVQVEQTVAMPQSLLTRINSVVTTMENELEEDSYCRALQDENQSLSSALKLNDEAMQEIAELRRREMQMKNELVEARTEVNALEARLQSETSALNLRIGELQQLLRQAQQAEAVVEREAAQARAEETAERVEIAELRRVIEGMRKELEERDLWAEELKRERDELRRAKEAAERQYQQEASRVESLEWQLKDIQAMKDDHMRQLDEKHKHISGLEGQLKDAEHRVNHAHQSMSADATRKIQALEAELEEAQVATRKVTSEFTYQMRLKDEEIEMLRRREAELKDALARAEQNLRILELELEEARSSRPAPVARVSTTAVTMERIQQASRSAVIEPLLPGNNDPFLIKVREGLVRAEEAMIKAEEAHAVSWRAAVSGDLAMKEGQLERSAALSSVKACEHDLTALREEVFIHHQFSKPEQAEIVRRLEMEIQRVKNEESLLSRSSPMDGLHDDVHQSLTMIHKHGPSTLEWEDDFTVMHYAVKNQRTDVLSHLLKNPATQPMLNSRDVYGRLPIAYASPGMRGYLMQAGSQGAPIVSQKPRIEPDWQGALDQAERDGFYTVNWQEGYTLLHYAAETGDADLARWCLDHLADPNQQDAKGRSPIFLAESNGHMHLLPIMRRGEPTFRLRNGPAGRASTTSSFAKKSVSYMEQPRESMASTSPSKPKVIPAQIMQTIQLIDKNGWDHMNWKEGYTLLHWAAKHDMDDLCDRFMFQGADKYAQDVHGRTPIDIARQHNSFAALEQLERGPSSTLRPVTDRQVSQSARASVFVHDSRRSLAPM